MTMKTLSLIISAGLLCLLACCREKPKDEADPPPDRQTQSRGKAQPADVSRNDMNDEYDLKVFAEGSEIDCPNGLLVDGNQLIVAGWGLDVQDDLSTKTLGRLLALDLVEKKSAAITPSPIGNLDGVESDGEDGFYVSDFMAGKVFHIHGDDGHRHVILTLPPGTADLAYLVDKQLLIVPEMLENKVTAFDLRESETFEADEENHEPRVAWTISEGIQTPESVYFDKSSGFLFVSQIGAGGGMAKDGDGWISKLSTDGKVIENKWVTGFNAPKGLRSHDRTLWVADIDRIVAIDIEKAAIIKEVSVPGARFLNDIACDAEGTVYVSDLLTRKIHKYQRKK